MNEKELDIIKKVFKVDNKDITFDSCLKKGMTNKSYTFIIGKNKYIMRVPGKGTESIINRNNEIMVYNLLKNKEISDDVIYIDRNGYKITKYIEGARCCNPNNKEDVKMCMRLLKQFHNEDFKVKHEFDIFEQITLYEELSNKKSNKDNLTKEHIFSLKEYISKHTKSRCLAHIDAIPDNFLIYRDENNNKKVKLIDFEYSALQDPHIDIAMFCIYALYDKRQIDELIDIYFENTCPIEIRIKIYCYISACGFLWYNWCKYKELKGIRFGKYKNAQYKYAKKYYKIAKKMIGELYE